MKPIMLVVLSLMTLGGCAGSLQSKDPSSFKNIAIINLFPDQINYISIGTTVFNNNYEDVTLEKNHKNQLTQMLEDHLESRGYKVTELYGKENIDNPDYDLVIAIYPKYTYSMENTLGYGVYQRTMLGKQIDFVTYTFMALALYIDGSRLSGRIRGESTTDISSNVTYKQKWADLTDNERTLITEQIQANVEDAMEQAIGMLGI